MKTKKELNALKEEVEAVNKKLHELTDDELEQVVGGDEITDYASTVIEFPVDPLLEPPVDPVLETPVDPVLELPVFPEDTPYDLE